jgi:hypothetical protein
LYGSSTYPTKFYPISNLMSVETNRHKDNPPLVWHLFYIFLFHERKQSVTHHTRIQTMIAVFMRIYK